jgi:GNAT superfamily N-acetyltransferase
LQDWLTDAFIVSHMFRLETEVDRTRRDLLRSRLRDTNTAASPVLAALRGTPGEHESPLHVWAMTETGALAGGLVGLTWTTWLHVTYLWVDEAARGAGLGGHLLARAEHLARTERACTASRLETWDFQAPRFYVKQGYEILCALPDYPPGITEYTLVKRWA